MSRIEKYANAVAGRMRRLQRAAGVSAPRRANSDSEKKRRSDEALRHFRLIVDSIPAPVAVMTPAGEVEVVNQLTLDYFGKTIEGLKGWSTANNVHPDDLPLAIDTWRKSVETGQRYEIESRHRRADGVYRWFRVNGFPLRDTEGRIVRWFVLQTDIEDRKQAEEKLRRSEAFLAEAQHLSRIGSFLWRISANEISWSEQLYRIFEFDPGTAVTLKRIATRVHPEDLPLFFDIVNRAISAGGNFENEHRLLMADQSVKYLHLIAHASRGTNGELEYFGAAQDVTESRRSEEALAKARSELAHVSRITSLGVLTASIAHEINQPLASIMMNAGTALHLLARPEPDIGKAQELTKYVSADARRASDIIDRIRTMATRRESQQTQLSLDDVIEESMVLLRHEFQSRGISVSFDLAQGLPNVVADRTQIQQVIVNLAINAVQAMALCGGRNILIRTAPAPETVCCNIEDSGPGIDPAQLPRLFDTFFTTKDAGMGMGLPICRSIIEAHGGQIRADNDSALGGARFSFALPVDGAS